MSGGDILSEPTRGWCPNRNTWFPLELRWRPSRAAIPTKPCSYKEQVIGSASSHLRWNAGSILGLASSWAREAGFGLCGKSCKPVSKTKKIKKTKTNIRVDTGIWELWMEGVPKWWRLWRGDKLTSVVCRNTGLRVPLNPTRSILLQTRTANSGSSVHKPAYYCQITGQIKLLKSSASLTFFSSWSSAR